MKNRFYKTLYKTGVLLFFGILAASLASSVPQNSGHLGPTFSVVRAESGTSLSGYAWSDTIGWISFDCAHGSPTGGSICGTSNYGVTVGGDNTTLAGYAWSDNVGWISFNQAELAGCLSSTCSARYASNALSGWARACAGTVSGNCSPTTPLSSGSNSFTYSGSDQTFVVPSGATSLTVKMWGAGGGGGYGMTGGGGGFTSGTLAVSAGQVLTFIVGRGGAYQSTATTYGGGGGGGGATYTGSGGGRSTIRNSSGTELMTVGGGGGGGTFGTSGAGGGSNGLAGTCGGTGCTAGGGGGQAGGGSGVHYTGSNGSGITAGGGGGGWYGGGSSIGTNGGGGGGGGGSGYCGGAGVSGCSTTAGSGATPAGTGDSKYVSGIGIGAPVKASASGNGLITIDYLISAAPSIQSRTDGWDGWISLSGASPAYSPTLASAVFTGGYAWGSDVVGWINFTQVGIPTCTLSGPGSSVTPSALFYLSWTTKYAPSGGTITHVEGASTITDTTSPALPSGNTPAITAPASVGTYTYTMTISNTFGQSTCTTNVTVSMTPPTAALSPSSQTIIVGSNASFSYTLGGGAPTNTTYNVDGGSAIAASGGAFSVSGLLQGSHSVVMTVSNQGGSNSSNTANVTVNPPTCPNGLDYATYGPSCTCPGTQTQQPPAGPTCSDNPPSLSTFTTNPARVRANTATSVTFSWSGANLPAGGCSVSGTSVNISGAASPQTVTVTIAQPAIFTITCGATSKTLTIGVVPAFQER